MKKNKKFENKLLMVLYEWIFDVFLTFKNKEYVDLQNYKKEINKKQKYNLNQSVIKNK